MTQLNYDYYLTDWLDKSDIELFEKNENFSEVLNFDYVGDEDYTKINEKLRLRGYMPSDIVSEIEFKLLHKNKIYHIKSKVEPESGYESGGFYGRIWADEIEITKITTNT